MHSYKRWYLYHVRVWRHLPTCFSAPVRVLLLQSIEQVQGLWLLLLRLRHWFQEGSRAEELLLLSVGRKQSERKAWHGFTSCMHHKDQSQGNWTARLKPTTAAANPAPKHHTFCIAGTVGFDQSGYCQRTKYIHLVFLPSLWILYISISWTPHYEQ